MQRCLPMSEVGLTLQASPADHAICRRLIEHGSRSFHAASLLLPARLRQGAYALYAFCRLSDDAVDGVEGSVPEAASHDDTARLSARIAQLSARLDQLYAGVPQDHPVDRALADTVTLHAIPRALFDALLDGLAWDVAGRGYETLGDLRAYAARVAGTVGAMMAALMGVREPGLLARACDLGVAMQLTNIARDIGEDARMGRLYLPRSWLLEAGIDPDGWLASPAWSPALAGVTERLLQTADGLYAKADAGIAGLPADCRTAIRAARLIYGEIGAQVRREGLNPLAQRAIVPTGRKLVLALVAILGTRTPQASWLEERLAAALPETGFLIDAFGDSPVPALAAAEMPGPTGTTVSPISRVDERVGWVMDLFVELDRRQRRASFPAPPLQIETGGGGCLT
jgi:15-cis-phytoene synthase